MQSWISTANDANCHFPLQNLPFGVAATVGDKGTHTNNQKPVCVSAIGDKIINLATLEGSGLLDAGGDAPVFDQSQLNDFMALGPDSWARIRQQLLDLFTLGGNNALASNSPLQARVLAPMDQAIMYLPFKIAEYTDFYSGRQHAINVSRIFRGTDELSPNWLHMPIGYNGRASSVVVSGTDIHRPIGQIKKPDMDAPVFAACEQLDIELELGAVVGRASGLGERITTQQADDMIFGFVLLNDWSARDIQLWEYQPLGPFQGKAFGTSISPWIVTKQALAPFRCRPPAPIKPLLNYLKEEKPGLYDIELEVYMQPQGAAQPTRICQTNANQLYFSAAQQLAHHAIGGCRMNIGDLLGSGTISGPAKTGFGSLLEISQGGRAPFKLDSGETRSFIEDFDQLTLTGWAQGDGYRVGFGECRGRILPALPAV